MDSLPPAWNPIKFNTSAFQGKIYLTKQEADGLYLSIASGRNLGLIDGITPGIVSASKAVIVDSSKNIIGFNNLTMDNITSNLTISGTNSSLNLTGSSTILSITNTSQSTSSITGSIQNAGGIYCGANSRFAGNINLLGSLLITGSIAFQSTSGINMNSNSISNCSTFTLSGIQTSTNTTASTINTNGSLLLAGGIGISNTTDSISSTNGGTFTTAGGMAIAKKLFVGGDLSVGGNLTISGSTVGLVSATITDTGIATLVNPLTINHLLSSGVPTAGSFRMGMLFQGPNSSGSTIAYGRIYSTAQTTTAGSHQGSLTFSSVFAGAFVDVMTISSLTSSTNNLVSIAGATSVLSVYNISATTGTFSSDLTISKALSPSLTITSTNTGTQNQIKFITDNQTWEMGARGSTASLNPTNFYIYNTQMNMAMAPSGITSFLNTSVSTTSTSNAFQIAGGLYTAKAILNNSYYNCNINNNVAASQSISTQAICLNDQAIYFRGQNSSDTNHGIMFSGYGNSSWNSSNGFGNSSTNRTDGPVIFGYSGVMIGNLNSTGTETICATFSGTTTSLLGNVNINSPPVTSSRVNIQSFGTQLGLINNANGYAYMSSDSQGGFTLTTNNPLATPTYQTYLQYHFDSTWPTATAGQNTVPRLSLSGSPCPVTTGNNFRLHFGNTAADLIISLFNQSNLSSSYGFGANNNCIQYLSAGSNGHRFYYSSMTGVGSPTNLGSLLCTIDSNANVTAQSGFRAVGYNPSYTGAGAEIHYTASTASFFGYNRSTLLYTNCQLGPSLFINGGTYSVGIGTASSSSYPLDVSFTTQNLTGGYGYFTSSASSGTGGSTGNVNFSAIFRGRIAISAELDVFSDYRLKRDIKDIDEKYCKKFIEKIQPKIYIKKLTNRSELGYIAQDIVKNDFNELYCLHETEVEEIIEDDGFVNPANKIFTVNYSKIIPLLHKALQMSNQIIKSQSIEIEDLKAQLKTIIQVSQKNQEELSRMVTQERFTALLIEDLQKQLKEESQRLDEVIDYINEDSD